MRTLRQIPNFMTLGAPSYALFWRRVGYALTVFIALVLFSLTAHAQAKGKRLILKDGSYQIAREWKVTGDRVRFFSNERYAWEELPTSIVDWPATEKYEEDRAAGNLAGQQQAAAQDEADRKAEEE